MREHSPLRSVIVALSITTSCAGQVLAAPPEPANDIGPDEPSSHEEAAIAAFEAGRYDDAVTNFERAFELGGNPNNLFNIGRVYEEAGDLESAVNYYKRFISRPGVSLDDRKVALERIDVLEQIIAKTQPPEPEPEPEPTEPPPPVVESEPVSEIDTHAHTGAERRHKQRTSGFVLLGVGAAGLIAGGVVGGLASGVQRDLANTSDPAERLSLVGRGDSMALTADVLYVAGGTLTLVGLLVALTALPKRGTGQTAFAPTFNAGGGGVVVMHRF